jgi:hypothetical protein
MRDWLPFRSEYLNILLDAEGLTDEATDEGPTDERRCSSCQACDGSLRCLDCLGSPMFCIACCRDIHHRQPFHRVERWTGDYFTPAWLHNIGVAIYLGHGGAKCPSSQATSGGAYSENMQTKGTSGMEDDWEDEDDVPTDLLDDTPPASSQGMVIVDRSGVHHIGVHPCQCPNARRIDHQLLNIGIYPASQKNPKTGFTFRVLDDFLIDNRESKVPALSFYNKLRRVTNNAFPHTTPVCIYWNSPSRHASHK